MKVAIIGSRGLIINDFFPYLPPDTELIISGGAYGIDTCAQQYALENFIPFKVIRPNYFDFGKKAPLLRNLDIIASADMVIAFWDMRSRGTQFVIKNCKKLNKPLRIFTYDPT